jgi:hypothetical protein
VFQKLRLLILRAKLKVVRLLLMEESSLGLRKRLRRTKQSIS